MFHVKMHFQRQQEMKEFLYVNENLRGGDEEVPGQQRFQTENKDDDGNNLATENKKIISKCFTQSLFIYKSNKMPNSPIRR